MGEGGILFQEVESEKMVVLAVTYTHSGPWLRQSQPGADSG